MADASSEFVPLFLTAELEPANSSQLSLGNRTSVGASELLQCTITTVIKDVRRGFFVDGREPDQKHEAVVVVFEFEFGAQNRRSWNPLKRLSNIKISLSVDEAEGDGSGEADPGRDDDRELSIVARYPRAARGEASEIATKRAVALSLEPFALGVSAGKLGLKRESESTRQVSARLSSHPDGTMRVIWDLAEGGEADRGVPDVFACAVLLRTDGLPFSLELEFKAPVSKVLYRGKASMPIDGKHLWERNGKDRWESEWDDFDSDEFKEWVKRKTRNTWAESEDYGWDDA